MGLRTNPSQRQRRIGFELRKCRERAGLHAEEAGRHVDLGGPHLRHIEGGRTAIPEAKMLKLLDLYGCTRETYVDGLLAMHRATGKGWWHEFRHVVADRARDLAELESMSRAIRAFEPLHIPGLLQTPEYIGALMHPASPAPAASTPFRRFRTRRQELLTSPSAPSYHVVIHEAALHMRYVEEPILRRQLTHLIEVTRLPNIRVQIVPFRSGPLPAVGNPFTLFGSTDPELHTVLLEHDSRSDFLSETSDQARYSAMFEQLVGLALPALSPAAERQYPSQRDSLSLLHHLLYIL
ncbi:helix-turn-helix transcriptional regulator [Streptomyces sp. 549]|uniref:helix-turn-helix domain-containing protein n=1 Tax=Streptomyces sp. 549 TaxID=3049076 RepID=UPI0024C2E43F|nr:helix-turn-helix transcriptional regulator [Streptomyces sp. 549]MDK1476235.1 helix-turn-helix transcriptional regulator [Streptomyces sp. 549]